MHSTTSDPKCSEGKQSQAMPPISRYGPICLGEGRHRRALNSEHTRMQIRIVALALIFPILGTSAVEAGELPAREPLDALWEQYMLERDTNMTVSIEIRNGLVDKSVWPAKEPSGFWAGRPWDVLFESRNIKVMQLGEGFWGNGGWLLKGGSLGEPKRGHRPLSCMVRLLSVGCHTPSSYLTGLSQRNPAGTNSTSFSVRAAAPEPLL